MSYEFGIRYIYVLKLRKQDIENRPCSPPKKLGKINTSIFIYDWVIFYTTIDKKYFILNLIDLLNHFLGSLDNTAKSHLQSPNRH